MTWGAMLGEQLDFYRNAHFWPRIQGVTDEEYLWEPVTTIAWRLGHVIVGVLAMRGWPATSAAHPRTTTAGRGLAPPMKRSPNSTRRMPGLRLSA